MAEDMSDKTEQPTPRRQQEAREQGQVAHSADLTAALLLLGFFVLMNNFGPGLIRAMRSLLGEVLSGESLAETKVASIGPLLLRAVTLAAGGLAPMLAGALVIAIVANLLQVGFSFNPSRLQFNLGMLNPLRGLSRMWQMDNLVQLLTNLIKLALAGTVAWSALSGRIGQIISIQQLGFLQAFGLGASIIYAIGIRLALLMLVLAILDFAWKKYRNHQGMMMTKEEVKEEMRHMEGDPKIKQRRRQMAMQAAQQKLKHDVPKADVVVTNPTHFAIALKYDSATMTAPRVVAKGQGYMAQRIREIAIAAGVPIVERKPLARALYRLVQAGQEIPAEFYSAVAEILAYVYELTGKIRPRRAG